MRRILLRLATLLALTPFSHATQIDDFVLTSAHHTFTFSLPTPYYIGPTFGHTLVNFPEVATGTIDGVGGYSFGLYFYLSAPRFGGFDLNVNDTAIYQLQGPSLFGYSDPFLTGTFQFTDYPYPAQFLGSPPTIKDGPYTLTITPEAPASVTPEPATLMLLATGALGLLTTLRRRLTT